MHEACTLNSTELWKRQRCWGSWEDWNQTQNSPERPPKRKLQHWWTSMPTVMLDWFWIGLITLLQLIWQYHRLVCSSIFSDEAVPLSPAFQTILTFFLLQLPQKLNYKLSRLNESCGLGTTINPICIRNNYQKTLI